MQRTHLAKREDIRGSSTDLKKVKIKIYDKDDGKFDRDDLLGVASVAVADLSPSGAWIKVTRRKRMQVKY